MTMKAARVAAINSTPVRRRRRATSGHRPSVLCYPMLTITRRGVIKRLIGYPAFLAACFLLLWIVSIRMPGESFAGALPPLSTEQIVLRDQLRGHVAMLAGQIGPRNHLHRPGLDSAAAYVKASFAARGYVVAEQSYSARGQTFRNFEVTLPGRTRPGEIVIVGGHYDSVEGTPGADDNASGTAAVIELARLLKDTPAERTIKFVAFVNEEPPFFFSEDMGSRRYSKAARAHGDTIVAMLSLETIGYYRDAPWEPALPSGTRLVLSRPCRLHRRGGQHWVAPSGAAGPRRFQDVRAVSIPGLGSAETDPGHFLVGPMVILEGWV